MNFIFDGIPEDTQTLPLQINIITNGVRMDNILPSLTNLKKLDLDENQLSSVPMAYQSLCNMLILQAMTSDLSANHHSTD